MFATEDRSIKLAAFPDEARTCVVSVVGGGGGGDTYQVSAPVMALDEAVKAFNASRLAKPPSVQ